MRAPGWGLAARPVERVAKGTRGMLSCWEGGTQGVHCPAPTLHCGLSPLVLFVFLFPLVLGASGPAEKAKSCRDGSRGSIWGGSSLATPPQATGAVGGAMGRTCLALGSTQRCLAVG